MHPTAIVLLNGCSSAGKSSLAASLQRLAVDRQFLHVQMDTFRAMEPEGYFSPERKQEWPDRIAALCRAINSTALQFARHGQNVIIDHVLSPQAWQYVLEDFANEHVLLVKVSCLLEDAERREAKRADRKPGLARSQWHSVHDARLYDFEVNTSEQTPTEAAQLLDVWLRRQPRAEALATLASAASTA
jgi:chloramphenicol 3-O phosphotransferase